VKYVLGIDQGTTRSKAIIFDEDGSPVAAAYQKIERVFPKEGWVEQDPDQIWTATLTAVHEAMAKSRLQPNEVVALGIADQGETLIMWDKRTGRPIYNAIVWQCRRTADLCEKLRTEGYEEEIRKKTGLLIDPYFSATKVKWILENVENALTKAKRGDLLFGTTDTWLIWNLTNHRTFATDCVTASRTMMFNINTLAWDRDILNILEIPEEILPDVVPNSAVTAHTDPKIVGYEIPIAGVIVDQQAALFAHACHEAGSIKNTYGTGCFALMNTGSSPRFSQHGLLTTIAWVINKKRAYALDGGVFVAGAAVQWLREKLGLVSTEAETAEVAARINDTGGVYFVPAFVGLAAPYWDPHARGIIVGINNATTRAHLVRATLESIAYQVCDVIECMENDTRIPIKSLRVDGGPVENHFLMQFQADILGVPVEVPAVTETTAQGAAFLAGLATGVWSDVGELANLRKVATVYGPKMSEEKRRQLLAGWKKAVERAMSRSK